MDIHADPPEREFTLTDAETRARAFLHERGWRSTLWPVGTEDRAVWRCQLHGADGTPLPDGLGAGKGLLDAARVGALYEAIEHHLTGDLARYRPRRQRADEAAAAFGADVLGPLLAEQGGTELACVDYHPVAGHGGMLTVPLALSLPAYIDDADAQQRLGDRGDYSELSAYCTSSGSAIGATAAEAMLHGLNEVIERDALGMLLCRAFFGSGYRPVLIEPHSLPSDLAGMYRRLCDAVGREVMLVDLTTDLGVPTVLAYTAPGDDRARPGRGLGTSLSEHHALYRALGEFLQTELLDPGLDPDDLQYLAGIDPALRRASGFDLSAHLPAALVRPYRPGCPLGPVAEQLATVDAAVRSRGFVAYRHVLELDTDLLSVAQVVIPGLERTMTLLSGHLALPGPRGLHAAHATPAPVIEGLSS